MNKGKKLTHRLIRGDDKARLLQRTEITDHCWLWSGPTTKDGYGIFSMAGRQINAHLASYKIHIGIIPEGNEVHHTCFIRNCVNPDHLELKDKLEHRKSPKSSICPKGHPREDKIFPGKSRKRCRFCRNESQRRYAENNREKMRYYCKKWYEKKKIENS